MLYFYFFLDFRCSIVIQYWALNSKKVHFFSYGCMSSSSTCWNNHSFDDFQAFYNLWPCKFIHKHGFAGQNTQRTLSTKFFIFSFSFRYFGELRRTLTIQPKFGAISMAEFSKHEIPLEGSYIAPLMSVFEVPAIGGPENKGLSFFNLNL